MNTNDYAILLKAYVEIWNNRTQIETAEPEAVLKELILRELLDENTHPRARRTIYEKFFVSIQKIMASNLGEQEKNALTEFYIGQMEAARQGR
ncbi:hypothetical protein [Bacillus massiliglaciei]|uniref:hypothetical protein n=1 Tax=Bacillus massiliglaciei TaxID=1816693 RepID=UPI000DA605B2|nr:hypothetical protein [Bacillus massiliglaciei]